MKETLKRIATDKLIQLIEETPTRELIEIFQSRVKVSIVLEVHRNEIKELVDFE